LIGTPTVEVRRNKEMMFYLKKLKADAWQLTSRVQKIPLNTSNYSFRYDLGVSKFDSYNCFVPKDAQTPHSLNDMVQNVDVNVFFIFLIKWWILLQLGCFLSSLSSSFYCGMQEWREQRPSYLALHSANKVSLAWKWCTTLTRSSSTHLHLMRVVPSLRA
jgi:hypothetical protein